MAWLHGSLAVICLAVGLLHLARLIRVRRPAAALEFWALEFWYATMACGMAGMFSPVGDPVPAVAWAALFLLCAGWSAGVMLRARSVRALAGEALHLAVGSAAMLFMLGADQQAGGAHAAHTGDAPGTAGIASAVALVFATYFVLHTLRCADRFRAARPVPPARADPAGPEEPVAPPTGTATALRPVEVEQACPGVLPALAHLLMTVAMAVMLIGMI